MTRPIFWACAAVTLACVFGIVWLAVADVPVGAFGILPRIVLVALAVLFGLASLATTEIIPPKGEETWVHVRKPKVLGQLVFLLLSAASFIVSIGPVFNPPADKAGQDQLIETANTTLAVANDTAAKLTELERWLRTKFPDDPPILGDIGGRWGSLDPECGTLWDFEIVRRGEDAAIIAQNVPKRAGAAAYRFVGAIHSASGNRLIVEGVEPESARGATAWFTYNAATGRLEWDDRARGSGGTEIYRRCDG